jgi:hypothetical protein
MFYVVCVDTHKTPETCCSVSVRVCYLTTLSQVLMLFGVAEMSEWVWNIDGMILNGKHCSNGRETCPRASFSTTNSIRMSLAVNQGLRSETCD